LHEGWLISHVEISEVDEDESRLEHLKSLRSKLQTLEISHYAVD